MSLQPQLLALGVGDVGGCSLWVWDSDRVWPLSGERSLYPEQGLRSPSSPLPHPRPGLGLPVCRLVGPVIQC